MQCLTIGDVVKLSGATKVPIQYHKQVPTIAKANERITLSALSKMDISSESGGGGYVNDVVKTNAIVCPSMIEAPSGIHAAFAVGEGNNIRIGFCIPNPFTFDDNKIAAKSFNLLNYILFNLGNGPSTVKIWTNVSEIKWHPSQSYEIGLTYTDVNYVCGYMDITLSSISEAEYYQAVFCDAGEFESASAMLDSIQKQCTNLIFDDVGTWENGNFSHIEQDF